MVELNQHREDRTFVAELRAVQAGEESAWADLYREFAGPITGYLVSRGVTEAEDLAGEVFLQLARDIHRFEGDRESFRSWVFVIVHRRMIDWRRTMVRRPLTVSENLQETSGGNVEEEAIEQLENDQLVRIFKVLTDDQRDVLALRVVADLTLEQTATVTGKSIGAVKALQSRALSAVKAALDDGSVTL